ncbi:putative efflux protein, MATE family [Lachnospiraceae bacterium XBB1006]|nr:putative efflux protein, MATE family [Lachnospiraceae bacterium XBB1006]
MESKKQSIGHQFAHFVALNILSMVGVSCYILVDTFFIGNGVGADGLTALNLALPLFSVQQAFGFLFSVGCGTKYAILKARKEDEAADELVCSTVVWAGLFGTALAILIFVFARPLMILMGAKGAMIGLSAGYMRTVLSFTPFFLLNSTCNLLVKNDYNPKLAMLGTLSGSLFNIIFDYIFIYPMHMGMFGAALATGFSPWVNLMVLSFHVIRKKNQFHLHKPTFRLGLLSEVAKLGLTSAITELAAGVVVLVFNWAILSQAGNIGVAAYGVVANIAIVVMAIYNGIAQGMQPLVSTNYGLGKEENMHRLLRYAVGTTLLVSAGMYLVLAMFAVPIAELFNGEHLASLRAIASEGVRIYFTGIFFAGMSVVFGVYCNSREQVKKAFAIAVLRGGSVMVPVLLILLFVARAGMVGVWLSFPVSEAIIFMIALVLVRKKNENVKDF